MRPSTAPVLVARHAMATRFEIALHGSNPANLRAAAEEALDEIDRLESLLSLYRPGTDISRVNAYAHVNPVTVHPEVFSLLERAKALCIETGGAFDITVAPLVRCWGFMGGTGSQPDPERVAEARAMVGMHLMHLDPRHNSVRFERAGVMIDLGAIGKGYAVERAADLLRESGVESALLHGGTSSTAAIGLQPDGTPWKVAITSPIHDPGAPFAVVELKDESLSVSAVWGRSFKAGEKTFGHVIDPRSGQPVQGGLLSAIVTRSATDGDALTTALLIDPALAKGIAQQRPDLRYLVLSGDPAAPEVTRAGIG
jgi:FAD:protein FMN transferase